MDNRAALLIGELGLQPHPEGGYYREVYRSVSQVQPNDERPVRSALTTIYFLLIEGQYSSWHRVTSDEVWHFYEGDPLELFWLDTLTDERTQAVLGPVQGNSEQRPVQVVPAGCWQAARSSGAYTLVGCTVGPGFDFTDFSLLEDGSEEAEKIRRSFPGICDGS
ncbi:MAG: cupin domain-containing protein [Armatimonadota bacterium]